MNEKEVVEQKLQDIDSKMAAFITRATDEIKLNGKTTSDTAIALQVLATQGKELQDRFLAIEQRLTRPNGNNNAEASKSFGERFIASDHYKNITNGSRSSGKFMVGSFHEKTAIVNVPGQNQPLVPPYYVPGITTPAQQPRVVRDLLPTLPIKSNLIYYVQETAFDNQAGIQGAGTSPQVYENTPKPESGMTFALLYQPVQTVAHWIPVSQQILADSPALRGYIDARLMYGLKLKEENELLNGTGVGASIKGLLTSATAYNTAVNAAGDTKIDTVLRAGTQVKDSFYPWDWTILNPKDFTDIQLTKTTGSASSGEYVYADPHQVTQPRLWGKTVVESYAMPVGKFLAGSGMAATIWDREDATVEISLEHADFFVRNMAAILCEERIGLTVQVPKALIYGVFP